MGQVHCHQKIKPKVSVYVSARGWEVFCNRRLDCYKMPEYLCRVQHIREGQESVSCSHVAGRRAWPPGEGQEASGGGPAPAALRLCSALQSSPGLAGEVPVRVGSPGHVSGHLLPS